MFFPSFATRFCLVAESPSTFRDMSVLALAASTGLFLLWAGGLLAFKGFQFVIFIWESREGDQDVNISTLIPIMRMES